MRSRGSNPRSDAPKILPSPQALPQLRVKEWRCDCRCVCPQIPRLFDKLDRLLKKQEAESHREPWFCPRDRACLPSQSWALRVFSQEAQIPPVSHMILSTMASADGSSDPPLAVDDAGFVGHSLGEP